MPPTKLDKLLKPGSGGSLEKIIQTAQLMDTLTSALRDVLAADLAANLLAASLRENRELVVVCGSPAWASRIRFESDTLLAAARNAGFDAETVRVRVSRT